MKKYKLIPITEIDPAAKNIAIQWVENFKPRLKNLAKLWVP